MFKKRLDYFRMPQVKTALGIWASIDILQNSQLEIWATLNQSPVAISQNMALAINLADTTSRYFQETLAPEPIKIVSQIMDNLW